MIPRSLAGRSPELPLSFEMDSTTAAPRGHLVVSFWVLLTRCSTVATGAAAAAGGGSRLAWSVDLSLSQEIVVVVVAIAATVLVYRQRTGGKCNKFIPLSFLVNYSALCDVCIGQSRSRSWDSRHRLWQFRARYQLQNCQHNKAQTKSELWS